MPNDPDIVQIKVDGREIPDEVHRDLAFVRVEQSVTLPDRLDIQFYDPLFVHLDRRIFKVGSEIEISFRSQGRLTSVTEGFVTSVSAEAGRDTVDRLTVTGFDASFKLTLEPHSQTFQKQAAHDIAKKIAGAHRLSAKVQSVPFTYDYMLQHNETDYDFLQRLADQVGYRFWVTGDELYFQEGPQTNQTARLRMGEELVKISMRMSAAARADSAEATFWDVKQKKVIKTKVSNPGSATYAESNLLRQVENDASKAFKKVTTTTGHFTASGQPEAEAFAEGRLRSSSAGQVILKGEAIGSPKIKAGSKVNISGAGDTVSGTYLLTSVEHVYGANVTYVTRFTSGEREPAGLVDLLGGRRNPRSASNSPWGQMSSARVTNVSDPEDLGRIKVAFPTLEKEEESDWVRVLSPGAGKSYGLQLFPEVGDEVLVGFEFGDPRRPVVLGGLWNGKDNPADKVTDFFKSGKVVKRSWTSRTGHSIELHDGSSAADQKIVIANGKSKATIILTDKGIDLKTTGADDKVTVDSAGDVDVKSKKNIEVTGQKVTVEGKAGLELKGPKITIQATGNVVVKGAAIQLN